MSRFGGHETFSVREGWLSKALTLLKIEKDLFKDAHACDRLGVGRNMAKSIRHWLQVAGLIENASRNEPLEITRVGKLIMRKDPYFLRLGTWWALHINIATRGTDAVAWHWFFNRSYPDRFDRFRFASDLIRQLTIEGRRLPAAKTLNNDVNCLLSSYAVQVPSTYKDPEEGHDCPFQSLGLMIHLRETDTYLTNRRNKQIPSAIVGYAFSVSTQDATGSKHITKPLVQVYSSQDGPGKTLVLDQESFSKVLQQAEDDLGADVFHVELSGGERTVRFIRQRPDQWLECYYKQAAR